jgi:hypothetical protein
MIDWALETYSLINEEQPQELMDRPALCYSNYTEVLVAQYASI